MIRTYGVFALIASIAGPAFAAEQPAGTARVDYFGYKDCVELKNEQTRVVLCHQAGGRVLEYSLDGLNALYLDPAAAGSVDDGEGRPNMTGGRFDIGPENIAPKRPTLWRGRWEAEIIGPRAARLTSAVCDNTGVRLTREFRLDEHSTKLDCKQTIHNVSDELKVYNHWSRTFAVGDGITLIPLTPPSRFPSYYTMRNGRESILFRPQDDNIRVREGYLEILAPAAHPKLCIESYAGWFVYLMPHDVAFIKRFPAFRDRPYGEVDGHNISIWYPQDSPLIELEPIGPSERLQPGEKAAFTETWELKPFEFPKEDETADLAKIEQLVQP